MPAPRSDGRYWWPTLGDGTLQLQLKLMASKLDFKASSTPMLNLPISFQKQAASNIETVTSMTPYIWSHLMWSEQRPPRPVTRPAAEDRGQRSHTRPPARPRCCRPSWNISPIFSPYFFPWYFFTWSPPSPPCSSPPCSPDTSSCCSRT